MNFSGLPNWAQHVCYIAAVVGIGYTIGVFSAPEKKIEIEKTAEFKAAVDKSVAELKQSMVEEWNKNTKIVYITKSDGTKIETRTTQDQGKKSQDKTEIKEVIKEVIQEKIVEKTVIVENKANWALGVTLEPLPVFHVPPEWILGVSLDRRIIGGFFATVGAQSPLFNFSPTFTLGIKWEF
jgi:hypothetical protein